MIDSLAIALGLGSHDPAFWMPLVVIVLFFAIIVAGTVLDGFDIGVGCLALFAPAELRPRMLALRSNLPLSCEPWKPSGRLDRADLSRGFSAASASPPPPEGRVTFGVSKWPRSRVPPIRGLSLLATAPA